MTWSCRKPKNHTQQNRERMAYFVDVHRDKWAARIWLCVDDDGCLSGASCKRPPDRFSTCGTPFTVHFGYEGVTFVTVLTTIDTWASTLPVCATLMRKRAGGVAETCSFTMTVEGRVHVCHCTERCDASGNTVVREVPWTKHGWYENAMISDAFPSARPAARFAVRPVLV